MTEIQTTAIIPGFNEQRTIGPVVRAALRAELVDGIVVVDDGSRDRTVVEAWRAIERENSPKPFEVVSHSFNAGKTEAVRTGVDVAYEELGLPRIGALVFIDADLSPVWSRLTPENMKLTSRLLGHTGLLKEVGVTGTEDAFIDCLARRIDQITAPILERGMPMTIGMPQRNWFADRTRTLLNWGALGGNRGVRADFFDQLIAESQERNIGISGWELEAALNTFARKRRDEYGVKLNQGIEKFLWDDIVNVGSRVKTGSLTGGVRRMAQVHGRAVRGLLKYGYQF